jgi:hypothetical protein
MSPGSFARIQYYSIENKQFKSHENKTDNSPATYLRYVYSMFK